MIDNNARARELLALPFDDVVVRQRPEIYCESCRTGAGQCPRGHQVVLCETCSEVVSTAHIHVEYVPHEHVRDRLDQVDPDWSWAPLSLDERGLPAFDQGCLWITMTVSGKTVYGVGDGAAEVGARHRRLAVTNAIKNAAEALGVARDLRLKDRERPPVQPTPDPEREQAAAPDSKATAEQASHLIGRIVHRGNSRRPPMTPADIETDFLQWSKTDDNTDGTRLHEASADQMTRYLTLLGGKA